MAVCFSSLERFFFFNLIKKTLNKKYWFNYSSNLSREFTVEYTFCLFSPPEHTLAYVFLFTLKYIGSVLPKKKDERFFKKSDSMPRRLECIEVPASTMSLLPVFVPGSNIISLKTEILQMPDWYAFFFYFELKRIYICIVNIVFYKSVVIDEGPYHSIVLLVSFSASIKDIV